MRILVAHLVEREAGGGMSRLMERVHGDLARAGHDVEFRCADDVRPAFRRGAGRLAFSVVVRQAAADAARRGRPFDIVNVHEPHGAVVAALRGGIGGAAVVAMTHGVERRGWEIALRHRHSRPSLKTRVVHPATTLRLAGVALRRADHVICLNQQDATFLSERFGVPPARTTVVVPGAEPAFGAAAGARAYARVQRILFAGTWLPRKGVHELAEAFGGIVATSGAGVTLEVAGAGVPEAVVRRAFPARAAEHVRVLPRLDEREMAEAMRRADLFVLPSLFEGTPLTLIEAMWSGLPVVTTRTAGMQDVVSDGATGLLVPPGDAPALGRAMARLVQDAELRRRLGCAAHAVASRTYTWARTAAQFEAAYRCARGRGA